MSVLTARWTALLSKLDRSVRQFGQHKRVAGNLFFSHRCQLNKIGDLEHFHCFCKAEKGSLNQA